ncbi:MAG: HEAT repeat domain-containing protein, partial [Gammaproteobacteria bacterium]
YRKALDRFIELIESASRSILGEGHNVVLLSCMTQICQRVTDLPHRWLERAQDIFEKNTRGRLMLASAYEMPCREWVKENYEQIVDWICDGKKLPASIISVAGANKSVLTKLQEIISNQYKNCAVGEAAINSLGWIAAAGINADVICEYLIAFLQKKENDIDLRKFVANALGLIGAAGVNVMTISEQLIVIMQDKKHDTDLREAVIAGLWQIGARGNNAEAICRQLITVAHREENNISLRYAAINGLGQIGGVGINVEVICQQLFAILEKTENTFLCHVAANGLSWISTTSINAEVICKEFLKMLQEKENKICLREIISNGLGFIGAAGINAKVISEQLSAVLEEEGNSTYFRQTIVNGLGRIGAAGFNVEVISKQLIAVLQAQENDIDLRRLAADKIGEIGLTGVTAETITQQLITVLQDKNNDVYLRHTAVNSLGQIGAAGINTDAICQQLIIVLQEKANSAYLRCAAATGLRQIGETGINVKSICDQFVAILYREKNNTNLRQSVADELRRITAAGIELLAAVKILALICQVNSTVNERFFYLPSSKYKDYLLYCLEIAAQSSVQSELNHTQIIACLSEIFYDSWYCIDSLVLHIYISNTGHLVYQLDMIVAGKIWFPEGQHLKPETTALLLQALQYAAAKIYPSTVEQANIKLVREQLLALTQPPAQPTVIIEQEPVNQDKNCQAVIASHRVTTEQVGALIEVKGRVDQLARAIAICMPAAVSIGQEGLVSNAQSLAIGSLDPSLSESSKKFLYEKVIDNAFSDTDPVVKSIQEQLSFLRYRLLQPSISIEIELGLYNRIEQSMLSLTEYYVNKQQGQRAASTVPGSFFNQGSTSQNNQPTLDTEKGNNNLLT